MLSAGRMRCCSGDTVNGMVFVGGVVGNGEKNYHLCALKRGYGNKFDK